MDSHTHCGFGKLEIVEMGRRRRWSDEEKQRIVLESMSGPCQVSATARRHNVARSQLLAWRRAMPPTSSELNDRLGVPSVAIPDNRFVPKTWL